jgi:hypothetical protein
MTAPVTSSLPLSIFDCRYDAERLAGLLMTIDEVNDEGTTDLCRRLEEAGIETATLSALIHHSITTATQLVKDLRRLEDEDERRRIQAKGAA